MHTVLSKDGTAIAFDLSGEGPAVILVDGALCYRGFGPMGPLAALLRRCFTVFSYDRRGRGESSDTPPYAIEREVEDVEALIQEAGGEAFVYGISSGAALALKAAASGLNIKKLAIYEPPFVIGKRDHRPPEDSSAQLRELEASGRRGEAVEFFMTKMVGLPGEAVAPMRGTPVWTLLEATAPTLVYDATIMEENSWLLPRWVSSVKIPTLAMVGGESPGPMHQAVQAVADAVRGAQLRILEGQTHEVAPEAMSAELEAFFLS